MKIAFTINKQRFNPDVDPRMSLLELVRELGFTGAKQGCAVGECGACTMIVDGKIIDACIYLAVRADGKDITTIEGVGNAANLSVLQQSFVEQGAVQCGFCTPGMVLAATNLLAHNPKPTRAQVRREMSGNLCRCTGYKKIVDAVMAVSEEAGV